MTTTALTVLALLSPPLDLERLTAEAARALDGRPALVTFLPATPADFLLGRATVGAADQPDGVTRGAVLRGRRFDVREGKRLTVRGTVRVIDHDGHVVNSAVVLPRIEVRVEEWWHRSGWGPVRGRHDRRGQRIPP